MEVEIIGGASTKLFDLATPVNDEDCEKNVSESSEEATERATEETPKEGKDKNVE